MRLQLRPCLVDKFRYYDSHSLISSVAGAAQRPPPPDIPLLHFLRQASSCAAAHPARLARWVGWGGGSFQPLSNLPSCKTNRSHYPIILCICRYTINFSKNDDAFFGNNEPSPVLYRRRLLQQYNHVEAPAEITTSQRDATESAFFALLKLLLEQSSRNITHN